MHWHLWPKSFWAPGLGCRGSMGFGVQGVEVRIQGVWVKACGVGFGVEGLGCRVGGYTGIMGNTTETTVL